MAFWDNCGEIFSLTILFHSISLRYAVIYISSHDFRECLLHSLVTFRYFYNSSAVHRIPREREQVQIESKSFCSFFLFVSIFESRILNTEFYFIEINLILIHIFNPYRII